ncbi:MAG: glycosyltransferase family 2 protein [Gammaproteobacteria bacterium]|jgi:exo-beta-1,3-glucanase (GH17 family)/cellulose synthase/poly-beta-1,6-N-acetylglucosamine synthase-like glycosyltransferase
MYKSSVIIGVAFAALTVSLWAWLNRPETEPAWPARVQGFAFSPFQADEDAVAGRLPTDAEIRGDLELLAGKTNAVRTYTVEGTLGDVPRLARPLGVNVALGAWIDARLEHNESELGRAIDLARSQRNIVRVIVGNEVVLRGDIPEKTLLGYLDRARRAIRQPVSTAEPWHVWLRHPELAQHVDYLAVHLLPYWEGIDVDRAVDYAVDRYQDLQKAFPHKPIVVAEVGWPSNGRTRGAAVASPSNEALFLRRFLARAENNDYVYYVLEAFDQPWKARTEGAVGAYWGVYNAARQPKFAFTSPIVRIPAWRTLAAVSVGVAGLVLTLFFAGSSTLGKRGRSFLAVIVYTTATTLVWILYEYSQQYQSATSVAVGILLFAGMLGVILVLLAEAHEWAEANWVQEHRRLYSPGRPLEDPAPRVSIHVPAYNEPPGMLIETLDALAALDYPNFEVVVVDNNTPDAAIWRPVERHCRRLGPRFCFYHVAPLAGFKAGALNFALEHSDPAAEFIAVIDSDYVVDRHWLSDLIPAFERPDLAIVQAPQDYRDADGNAFKAMCYAEYRGFFYIGMVTRNERNAIIQHGTMTLVRRRDLETVSGWAEWCITEDAELGLRLFESGRGATYIPRSYGRGLMPDTFLDYKKQRYRWAFGAMQILRRHLGALLLPWRGALTAGQRYHFIAGWLPWLADGFNLAFNIGALAWSVAMLAAPRHVQAPLLVFSALPLALFGFKLVKLFHLYRTRVKANLRQTLAAAVAGLALTHTIGKAILTGLAVRERPFFRTPKRARGHALGMALASAREEALLGLALLLAFAGLMAPEMPPTREMAIWKIMLVIQAVPYLASVVMSLISALPDLPARWIGRPGSLKQASEAVLHSTGRGRA